MSLNGKIVYCVCKFITKRLIFPDGSESKRKSKGEKNFVVLNTVYTVLDHYST